MVNLSVISTVLFTNIAQAMDGLTDTSFPAFAGMAKVKFG